MQKTHSLKSYAVSLLSVGIAVLSVSASHAVFTTVGTPVTKSATAQLIGNGTVSMTVTAKNLSDNATVANIAWTGVTLPTGWKNADQYVELASSITDGNGGIRIVTDNRTSSPAYSGVSNATAAGLVDNTNTANTLQVAWSIKDSIVGSTGPVSAKPYDAINDGAGQANQFQWLFMTDVVDPALAQGAPYRTAVSANGIHFGGGDTEFGTAVSPNYVYLEANFASAVTPRTYSTSKLIVEAFTQ